MGVMTDIAANVLFKEDALVATNLTPLQLCVPDPTRYSLMVSLNVPSSTTVAISTNPNGVNGRGILQVGWGVIELKVSDWGPLVQQAWYLYSGTSGWEVTVFTVRIPGK